MPSNITIRTYTLKKLFIFTALSLFSSANSDMEALYLKNGCNGCHGMYGEGMGASPRLQGIREHVLLRRLKDLQNGKTRSAFGTIMISFAKALDENRFTLYQQPIVDVASNDSNHLEILLRMIFW